MQQEIIRNNVSLERKKYEWVDLLFDLMEKNRITNENAKRVNSRKQE